MPGKQLNRIERMLAEMNHDAASADKRQILKLLDEPMTTTQLAKRLNKHRTWVSLLVNELQDKGRVYEKKRKGRQIFYARV